VKTKPVLTWFFAGVFAVLGAGTASAQQQADANAAPARPDVKNVGDWQVRCFPVQNANPCDIFQEMADQNTHQRILSFSLAYAPSMDRHLLQITVPLDVAIQKGVTIQTDSFTSPVMKYRMCSREGCFVQLVPDNAMIASLVKAGPDAKVNIWADNGKSYGLKFSLKGFAQAHDDMVAQAKAKAKPAKDAAPAKPN